MNAIALQRGQKRENEEFFFCGMVPMELINLFKVRNQLGLDVPHIDNPLFQTNMAKYPEIPTGYSEDLDLILQTVKLTAETRQKQTFEQVEEHIKEKHGEDAEIFR